MKQLFCVDVSGDVTKYKPLINDNNDVLDAFEYLKVKFNLPNDFMESDDLIEDLVVVEDFSDESFYDFLLLTYICGAWIPFTHKDTFHEAIHKFNKKHNCDLFSEDLMLMEEMEQDKELIGFSRTDINEKSLFEIPMNENNLPNVFLGAHLYFSNAFELFLNL